MPAKFSKIWFLFAIIIFILVVGAMAYISWTLDMGIETENLQGYALVGLAMALVLAGGGFFGARIYFVIAFIVNIFGLGYMIYLAMVRTANGWSDLVSFLSYLFLSALGVLLGIIVQLIASIRKTGRS